MTFLTSVHARALMD